MSELLKSSALWIAYVYCDVGRSLLVHACARWGQPIDPGTLVVTQQTLSLSICVLAALYARQLEETVRVLPSLALAAAPAALCFTVSKLASTAALLYADAATVRLAQQLTLPCTAILSAVSKRWSSEDGIPLPRSAPSAAARSAFCRRHARSGAVLLTTAASVAFAYIRARTADESTAYSGQDTSLALAYSMLMVVASSCGGLAGERYLKLKKGLNLGLAAQKSGMLAAELVVAFAFVALRGGDAHKKGNVLDSLAWTPLQWLACLSWLASGWVAAAFVRSTTALTKSVAQAGLCTLLTYFASVAMGWAPIDPVLCSLALIAASSASMYAIWGSSSRGSLPRPASKLR